jgi:hypothetical protein
MIASASREQAVAASCIMHDALQRMHTLQHKDKGGSMQQAQVEHVPVNNERFSPFCRSCKCSAMPHSAHLHLATLHSPLLLFSYGAEVGTTTAVEHPVKPSVKTEGIASASVAAAQHRQLLQQQRNIKMKKVHPPILLLP